MPRKLTLDNEFNVFITNYVENLNGVLEYIKDSEEDIRIRFTWKDHIRTFWNHIKEYANFGYPENLTELFLEIVQKISQMNIGELRLDGESRSIHILIDSKNDIYISNNTAFLSFALEEHEEEDTVGDIQLPFKVWIQTKPDGSSVKTTYTWKIINDWRGKIMFSIVIGSDKYTVFDIENDMEKHVSYSNVNRSGLEDFGLDQDNLLSIKSLNGFNLNKVYIQLSEKNDIRKNNTWWSSRMTDDLISILTDDSRAESFGYIELAEPFESRNTPLIDNLVKKDISILPVPPPSVFKIWPDLIHHFFEILYHNHRLFEHQKFEKCPISIINDLEENLRTKVSNYLDNESNPESPTRFLGKPGKETPEKGAGRRINGVTQILSGWKEIPVHKNHPNYYEYRKRMD